jgi:kynureninase
MIPNTISGKFNAHLDKAIALDQADELASFREAFHFPVDKQGQQKIYLCGNSLGLQPKRASEYVQEVMADWARLGVDGHMEATHPWMPYHEFLTPGMAAIMGALPHEVVVMNSLTVNLHLLMISFYRPTAARHKILIEKGAFPSDRYAVLSQIKYHGFDPDESLIEVAPRDGEDCIREEDLLRLIQHHGSHLALILIGNVNYYTGQSFPMKLITDAGHRVGAYVAFDLAHGAGNIICDLHEANVDFAAWCSYKYLNSGPGALSGIFVHERHGMNADLPRFSGWWGHNKSQRFKMGPDFQLISGAEGWQLSNPPILPMACMRASIELFQSAGIARLRLKSVQLTDFLIQLLDGLDTDRLHVVTPRDANQRGSQISIRVKGAEKSLFQAITQAGVVADWREPDVIRVACAPLYNNHQDVVHFVSKLNQALNL